MASILKSPPWNRRKRRETCLRKVLNSSAQTTRRFRSPVSAALDAMGSTARAKLRQELSLACRRLYLRAFTRMPVPNPTSAEALEERDCDRGQGRLLESPPFRSAPPKGYRRFSADYRLKRV